MNKCRAPCGHYYCRDCLVNLVEACTRDESLFPLRCCKQALPIRDVRPFLPLKIRALFLEKSAEFSTPSLSRIYCPNPTCSIFLGPSDVSTRDIRCPRCATTVCLACKQRAHHGENCAESAMTLEVKALARSENWQTCPGCNAIIELDQGCHHMTCRCRTEFCYVCAARWKNCTCPQWEEARLLGTAERRVVNEMGVRAQAAAPDIFLERVRERVADLRVNHDCVNHRWRYRHGGGRCEECSHTLPQYLLVSLRFAKDSVRANSPIASFAEIVEWWLVCAVPETVCSNSKFIWITPHLTWFLNHLISSTYEYIYYWETRLVDFPSPEVPYCSCSVGQI